MPFTPEFMQSTSRFRRYCENELVNLLCSSFAEKAQQHGIRLTAELRLPAALSIPDTELCTGKRVPRRVRAGRAAADRLAVLRRAAQ